MTLVPAYGRDYTSKAAVQKDFDANLDFLSAGYGGRGYVTKAELRSMGIPTVNVRYKKNTQVCVLKTTD